MKLSATTLTASLLVTVIAILLVMPMMLQWERPPMDSRSSASAASAWSRSPTRGSPRR